MNKNINKSSSSSNNSNNCSNDDQLEYVADMIIFAYVNFQKLKNIIHECKLNYHFENNGNITGQDIDYSNFDHICEIINMITAGKDIYS